MPYQREDSPVWWVSYTDSSGKRVRRTTGTTDRKEADALEAKWKLEAHQIRQWDKPPTRSFDELMLEYLRATQNDKRSHDRDLNSAKRLKPFFTGYELGTLKRSQVRAYIEKRKADGVQPGTINRELGLLSAAINYARREWDWDIPNNVEGARLREPEGRVRSLEVDEAERLVECAEQIKRAPYLADFIRLALNTGCRRDELLRLEWSRVDLKNNLIHLAGANTKSGKRRSVPLNQEARQALLNRARSRAEHSPASPWVFAHKDGQRVQSVKRSFSTACEMVGIVDFRIHDLRHTCASWLVTAGQSLHSVRDLLGHSTVKMTERYAHLSPDNVRAAVLVLDGVSRNCHADKQKALTGDR
jgi:integrase